MRNRVWVRRMISLFEGMLLVALFLMLSSVAFGTDLRSMRKVPPESVPQFVDDLPVETLEEAIAHSLNYLKRLPPGRTFRFSNTDYSVGWLIETLQTFQQIAKGAQSPSELSRLVQKEFDVYQATGRQGSMEMLVTGYYEPILEGSFEKRAPFLYPLYSVPLDLVKLPKSDSGHKNTVGRLHNGKLVPYWSRSEIEKFGVLAGQELVYLADPIEAFILHIQGSGRVRLQDGTVRRIQYAAKNGRTYRSIGKLLIDEGKMEKGKVNLPALVTYLREHPEEQQRIFHHNESYIFFKLEELGDDGPLGSLGESLTAGRSIALDQALFPSGALCFLQSQRPLLDNSGSVERWVPMARFVLNQDSGSAIKGPGRLDLFWGSGQYARTAAGRMKHPGKLYFLIKKK